MTIPGRGTWLLDAAFRARWAASNLSTIFRGFWPTVETRLPVLFDGYAEPSPTGPYAVLMSAPYGKLVNMTGLSSDTENQLQSRLISIRIHARTGGGRTGKSIAAELATAVAEVFDAKADRPNPSPDRLVTIQRVDDLIMREGDDEWSITLQWVCVVDAVYAAQ